MNEVQPSRFITIKIQANGFPVIIDSCELTVEEADRIARLFSTVRDNLKEEKVDE